MANSKTGETQSTLTKSEIKAQIAELQEQLKSIDSGKPYTPKSTTTSSTSTITTDKVFYNDIINDSGRTMYDMRNYKNFRSNSDYKKTGGGSTKTSPNPNRSYYLSDICYSDCISYTDSRNLQLNPDVQTIVLNEFQPNLTVNVGKVLSTLADGMVSKFTAGVDTSSKTSIASLLAESASNIAAPALRQKAIDYYSKNPSALYGSNGKGLSGDTLIGSDSGILGTVGKGLLNSLKLDPMEQIRYMFQGGKWLNTYELPFFNDAYLETCKEGQWEQEGINQSLSDPNSVIGTVLQGLKIDFPTAPIYKLTQLGSAGRSDLEFHFYLINKDEVTLLRNFQFLSAFFSGTQWVAMTGGSIVSPNVYNVHVPGRFQMYWATLKIKVTCEGRLTRIPELRSSPIFKELKSIQNIFSPTTKEQMGPLWPEAWKIDCTVHDLTLNNFNTYIDYHVDGWNQSTLVSLEEDHSLANTITSTASNIYNTAKDYIQQGINWVTSSPKDYIQQGINWVTSSPASEMGDAAGAETEKIEAANREKQKARQAITEKINKLMDMMETAKD